MDTLARARRAKRQAHEQGAIKQLTWQQWLYWSETARYMDGQPERCIRAPFPDDPPISYRLLQNMARLRLVRHRNSDCRWQLSPRWETILNNIATGITAHEEHAQTVYKGQELPFVVDYGVDTLYVNVLAQELPLNVLTVCSQYKAQAQLDYNSVQTSWHFGGIPLSMLPNGKASSQTGGVSWGYILRNELVEIRLRKKPMSGIIAAFHFLAKCLWLNGAKPSLDFMERTVKSLWGDPRAVKEVRYQLSQIHLCADIAHFPLDPDYLPRLVTHSLKRTIHLPSQDDLDLDDSVFDEHTAYSDDDDELFYGLPPEDFLYDDADPLLDIDPDEADYDGDEEEGDEGQDEDDAETEAAPWHEEGAKLHWRGKAIEGFGFSPAGPLSAAWYDKILEERKSKKKWMRVIHEANGWQIGMRLTRIELRYRREILGHVGVALGYAKGERWFDDPRVALDHVGDLWGYGVGLPPEHDFAPDVTHRGWMRLAIPDPLDRNRSRWRTDPVWEVVQRVPFNEGIPKPLKQAKEVKPDLEKIDAELRGLLVTRAMLREAYVKAPASLSRELESFDDVMAEWEQERGLDFAEQVRERARMAGKAVPFKPPLVRPAKPRGRPRKSGVLLATDDGA